MRRSFAAANGNRGTRLGWAPVVLVGLFLLPPLCLSLLIGGDEWTGFILMAAALFALLLVGMEALSGWAQRNLAAGGPTAGGTVVDVREGADRLVLEVLTGVGAGWRRLRFEVPKDWDINFGDRVRLQGRYALWAPADGDREFPLPLLRFAHCRPEPEDEAP